MLGVVSTVVDFLAAQGDVSPPVTLAVLLAAGFALGWLTTSAPWLAAVLLGSVLPAAHLVAHGLGLHDNVSPNTYTARLLIAPVTIAAALLGTWMGRTLRWRGRMPPSP
jgi:hydrogenase/urease accessory protein HupE